MRGSEGGCGRRMSMQLELKFESADGEARAPGAGARAGQHRPARALAPPVSKVKRETGSAARLDDVVWRLEAAFEAVAGNKGAAGPDRQSIEQVREHLPALLPVLRHHLLKGTYVPGDIRRVWIPKAGGGQRGLGIPNVIDRVVQEAVRQVLEPLYEPTFHPGSHGFRAGRSCHTAIGQAREYLAQGRDWVVDIDLENFFNRVNHQRLMSRLALRVDDKRLLQLIGRMLKARVVMPDGLVVGNDEGVPQGGPLSPLLSNVVLDELDWELHARGLCFVRYADDANIYVRSERAGQRVMAGVSRFIEGRLRLKVNTGKSAVARPEERHFLGFSLRFVPHTGAVEVGLSKRTRERIDNKIRELTPRPWGDSLKRCVKAINAYVNGWMGFFGICTAQIEKSLQTWDAHIRRRLRAIQLKQWKRRRTMARKLIEHGVKYETAWRTVKSGGKSLWALSHTWAVNRALSNSHWERRGLKSLTQRYREHPARQSACEPEQYALAWG